MKIQEMGKKKFYASESSLKAIGKAVVHLMRKLLVQIMFRAVCLAVPNTISYF